MSELTPEELDEIKRRANTAIINGSDNPQAARIGGDVLMLLLVLKMEKEKNSAPQ